MINFFKRKKNKGFVFTTKNLGKETANGTRLRDRSTSTRDDFVALTDYIQWDSITTTSSGSSGGFVKKEEKKEERKEVEPIEVFEELKEETPEISFENLDEKIKVVKERLAILSEHLSEDRLVDEYEALFYLENRKKYLKTMKKTPLDWALTTQEAVDDLCKRYKLKVVPLQQYYTLIPKDGLSEMERFTKAYTAITGDKPIIQLVIKDTQSKEVKKKDRDPILLGNSPLGNFMFVLGAWDDEVEVVDEIIYNGK